MIRITVEQRRGEIVSREVEVSVTRVPVVGESFEVQRYDKSIVVSGRVEDVHTGVRLMKGGGQIDSWIYVTLAGWRDHDYTAKHNKVQP